MNCKLVIILDISHVAPRIAFEKTIAQLAVFMETTVAKLEIGAPILASENTMVPMLVMTVQTVVKLEIGTWRAP